MSEIGSSGALERRDLFRRNECVFPRRDPRGLGNSFNQNPSNCGPFGLVRPLSRCPTGMTGLSYGHSTPICLFCTSNINVASELFIQDCSLTHKSRLMRSSLLVQIGLVFLSTISVFPACSPIM
jgi:hypothetical protein